MVKPIVSNPRQQIKAAFLSRFRMPAIHVTFARVLIVLGIVFALGFVYLHQKVEIYVTGYRLNRSYQHYNELSDERDYLLYSFAKELSLPKVNEWAKRNSFFFVAPKARLIRNPIVTASVGRNQASSLFSRLINIPSGIGTVLAGNRQHNRE